MSSQPQISTADLSDLPYFDFILTLLANEDSEAKTAFQKHVHWGYWPEPDRAGGSAEDYAQASETLCSLIFDNAKVQNGMRVLDVGCGFGGTIASLNERYSQLELVGLNIDQRQLARALESVEPKNSNKITFVHGNACKLPHDLGKFDIVLAVECIFHFPSRAQFFHEVARVLKPGGALTITDFVPQRLAVPLLKLDECLRGTCGAIAKFYGAVDSFFPEHSYRRLCRQVGFIPEHSSDITRHVQPTYNYLSSLIQQHPNLVDTKTALYATKVLSQAARSKAVTYKILSFKNAAQ